MNADPPPTEDLSALKLADLKSRCKTKGLAVSGTKAELIARLQGEAPPAKRAKTTASKKPSPTAFLQKPVFQTYLTRDPIVIKRNAHGHFVHPSTGLVFSETTKKVVGVCREGSGEVLPLTVADLEHVHQYHFELDEHTQVRDQAANAALEDEAAQEQRIEALLTELHDNK
jgi:hypothetical protein